MNIKIFLSITKKSAIDVSASLHKYEEKRNMEGKVVEEVYRGKIIFSITQKGNDGKATYMNGRKRYLNGFMDKSTAKVIFKSIADDTFVTKFGKGGIQDFGGSETEDGQLRARILTITPHINEENRLTHYIFEIQEGRGEKNRLGIGAKISGKPDVTAKSWVSYIEAQKMAVELLDYIQAQEIVSTFNGKPLHTIKYGKEGRVDIQELTPNFTIELESKFKGEKIADLSDNDLEYLISKTKKHEDNKIKGIYLHAIEEKKKRAGMSL